MEWVRGFLRRLIAIFRNDRMAKITLDDTDGEITFDSNDLIYIGYDEVAQAIVLCLKGSAPKYLPMTPGNIDFLAKMSPHFLLKAKQDMSTARDLLGIPKPHTNQKAKPV